MKQAVLTGLVVTMVVLHQDFWFWREARPLLFGFLPAGLWYHMFYAIGASATMWLLVKFAWPAEIERASEQEERER